MRVHFGGRTGRHHCVMNLRMAGVRMAALLLCLSRGNIAIPPTSFTAVVPSRWVIGDSVYVVVAIVIVLFSIGHVMIVLVSIAIAVCIDAVIAIMISVDIVRTLPIAFCLRLVCSCLSFDFLR